MSKQINLNCGCILSYKDIDFSDSYIKGIKKIAKKREHIRILTTLPRSILNRIIVYNLCDYHLNIINNHIINKVTEHYDNKNE